MSHAQMLKTRVMVHSIIQLRLGFDEDPLHV